MFQLDENKAAVLAKAIAEAWDELPGNDETELGPLNEAKAETAMKNALEKPEAKDAGIKLDEEQAADLLGQFKVYLDSAEDWGDASRMEEELASLFAA